MFRTQPRGFRWMVGGFALLAGLAFGLRFFRQHDRPALLFAVVCLVFAAYWLIFDRGEADPEDPPAGGEPDIGNG